MYESPNVVVSVSDTDFVDVPKKYARISLSIPMTVYPFFKKKRTDSDPTKPPEPVIIQCFISEKLFVIS